MSEVGKDGRSFLKIEFSDLKQLAEIARRDREQFFKEKPEWATYANSVLCVALCQGAAKHYVDCETGINDFDVYTFYKANSTKRWYAKRIKSYDFGNSKFGKSIDKPKFIGRRVDCLGRAINKLDGESIQSALLRFLEQGKTKTAVELKKKAIVLLEPDCGTIVWSI